MDERQQSSHDSRDMVDGRLFVHKDRSMKSAELDQTLTNTVHKNAVGLDQGKQLTVQVRSKLAVSIFDPQMSLNNDLITSITYGKKQLENLGIHQHCSPRIRINDRFVGIIVLIGESSCKHWLA